MKKFNKPSPSKFSLNMIIGAVSNPSKFQDDLDIWMDFIFSIIYIYIYIYIFFFFFFFFHQPLASCNNKHVHKMYCVEVIERLTPLQYNEHWTGLNLIPSPKY